MGDTWFEWSEPNTSICPNPNDIFGVVRLTRAQILVMKGQRQKNLYFNENGTKCEPMAPSNKSVHTRGKHGLKPKTTNVQIQVIYLV